jgi:thiamine-phosphate pyrophosphorylase
VPAPDFEVYLVSDRNQTRGRDLLSVIEEALKGGIRAVQLREKDLGGAEMFALAEKAHEICLRYNAELLINDRVDVALAMNAAGVQLGKMSLPVETARALLGPDKWIGASIHSIEEIDQAQQNGATFLVFGPVYFTSSKASFGSPQGITALKNIVESSNLPVYAIGGIAARNVPELCDTGVKGIAVISSIISAPDPKAAARELISLVRN